MQREEDSEEVEVVEEVASTIAKKKENTIIETEIKKMRSTILRKETNIKRSMNIESQESPESIRSTRISTRIRSTKISREKERDQERTIQRRMTDMMIDLRSMQLLKKKNQRLILMFLTQNSPTGIKFSYSENDLKYFQINIFCFS